MAPRTASETVFAGRAVVLSPHLDDAVFSLGAAIANATRRGAEVDVVTVFAGDVDSSVPAAWWDRAAGFRSEGEAAGARREEDRRACEIVGARPVWLPFADATYERTVDDDELWQAIWPHVQEREVVFIPGFPLRHVDHLRLARLALERLDLDCVGLYVEQPYAKRHAHRRPWRRPAVPPELNLSRSLRATWSTVHAGRGDRQAKHRAALAYSSQIPLFGRAGSDRLGRLLIRRVALYERLRGGEAVARLRPV